MLNMLVCIIFPFWSWCFQYFYGHTYWLLGVISDSVLRNPSRLGLPYGIMWIKPRLTACATCCAMSPVSDFSIIPLSVIFITVTKVVPWVIWFESLLTDTLPASGFGCWELLSNAIFDWHSFLFLALWRYQWNFCINMSTERVNIWTERIA